MSAVLEAVRPIEDYLVMPDAEIAERIENGEWPAILLGRIQIPRNVEQ